MKQLIFVLFIILLSGTFAAADLLDGLVLSMSFDEGSGKEAKDSSENGFAGTVNGNAKWVEGKSNTALEFNASTDHVAIADNAAFHIEDEITQAAWIKLNQLPGRHAVIFGTRAGGGARHIGFGYGMNPSNGIKVWTNGANGGFKDINDNATKLEVDKWYYVSYTHTTANSGKVKIYVDGEVTSEQDSNNPVAPAGVTSQIQIGTWSGEAWPGFVDEVRLWNRALSDAEMQESMDTVGADLLDVSPNDKLSTSWGKIKNIR